MKVLFLSKRIYTNKDMVRERYGRIYEFSRGLVTQGHQVCGLAFDYRRRRHAELQLTEEVQNPAWHSCDLYPYPVSGIKRYIADATRLIKKFSPDVLLSVSDVYHVVLGDWLSRRFRLAHIVDLYDNYECFGAARVPGAVAMFRRAVARADGIVCVSQLLKSHVINTCGPAYNPDVITNAVDTDLFKPFDQQECRRRLGLPDDMKLIGLGGAISGKRGVRSVFDAHRILAEANPDIHLVLAGARDGNTPIPEGDNIHYLGQLDYRKMPVFFGALDVGIIINRETSFARYCFPQKFFEMLACGLPVTVASIGDVKGMMEGCSQALFRPEDGKELAEAVLAQLDSPCKPDIEVLSWDHQAALLSDVLEISANRKAGG